MLPLSLLKTAINHPMLVELKNGETYNGHLASCDAWMNVYLTQVICTSRDGDRFWKMPECYIRGSTIKYLRIPDEVIENYKDESQNRSSNNQRRDGQNRPGRGGGQNSGGQRGGPGGNRPGGQNRAPGGGGGGGAGGGGGGGGFNQNRRPNPGQSSGGPNQSTGGPRPAKQQRK